MSKLVEGRLDIPGHTFVTLIVPSLTLVVTSVALVVIAPTDSPARGLCL